MARYNFFVWKALSYVLAVNGLVLQRALFVALKAASLLYRTAKHRRLRGVEVYQSPLCANLVTHFAKERRQYER